MLRSLVQIYSRRVVVEGGDEDVVRGALLKVRELLARYVTWR